MKGQFNQHLLDNQMMVKGHTEHKPSKVSSSVVMNNLVFSGDSNGRLIEWNSQGKRMSLDFGKVHEGEITCLGGYDINLVSGDSRGVVKHWSTETKECIFEYKDVFNGPLKHLAVADDLFYVSDTDGN